jgi:serine/threonine protein kinase
MFLLVVSGDVPPRVQVSALSATPPAPPNAPALPPGLEATNLPAAEVAPGGLYGATVAPGEPGTDNCDFSVVAAAVVVPPVADAPGEPGGNADQTMALVQTSPPLPPEGKAGSLDVTDADVSAPRAAAGDDEPLPPTLGNYQILKRLGRGGMGAVYLARQISLDRLVALKVMNAEWAQNPSFLVRFTREAYAAAQLVHHNVVQVYDIGSDRGIHYFSMEYISGRTLGELLKASKKLPPDEAAGYILQAARGLSFAHARGMIHRDIKPDNLMLNDQGVIKVADLGLVRTPGMEEAAPAQALGPVGIPAGSPEAKLAPGRSLSSLSNVTLAGQAMGTPAFMAPEQARDATRIDHRADIYSLGCTLYVLITGRPVFRGSTALEVMTAHTSEPVVRPDTVVKTIPRALSDIVVKMLAKNPDDRYASMDEVIKALEDFLQIEGAARLAQDEQHTRILEQSVRSFHKTGAAGLRPHILLGFFGGCTVLALLLLLIGFWKPAGGVAGLGLMTAVAYFVVHGLTHRTHLFLKVRDLVLSSSWLDLVKVGAGVLLLVVVLWLVGLSLPWLLAALLAVGLAVGFHYAVDRQIATGRAQALEKIEKLLKTLRHRGLSEEALQEFVCKNAGDHWEEYFEALFGYEAKLAARAVHGYGPRGPRPRFAAWRDPLVRWLDRYQRARQEARERRHLQAIEQANLQAQGVDMAQARAQAGRVAEAMIHVAAEIRHEAPTAVAAATVAPEAGVVVPADSGRSRSRLAGAAPPRRVNVQDIYQVAAQPAQATSSKGQGVSDLVGSVLGGGVRFMLGAALLVIGLLWLYSRDLLPGASNVEEGWRWQKLWQEGQTAEPLGVPLLPTVVMRALCSLGAVIAGLVLLVSALWRSWKIGVLTLLGAAVMVVGPVSGYLPEDGPLSPLVLSLAAGGALAALGLVFGRDT